MNSLLRHSPPSRARVARLSRAYQRQRRHQRQTQRATSTALGLLEDTALIRALYLAPPAGSA